MKRHNDWDEFLYCREFLQSKGFYKRNDVCYKFYEGDQWGDKQNDANPFPQLNVIRPQVDYKVSVIMQNGFSLNFSNAEFKDKAVQDFTESIADKLNSYMAKIWEHCNMDTMLYRNLTDACISGGVGIYSYVDDNGIIVIEPKNNTDVLFADEQEEDVQKQKYVILPYRAMVSELKREAKANGMDEVNIMNITSDSETQFIVGEYAKTEVKDNSEDNDGKCLAIMKFWKDEDGFVHFRKSTANAVIQDDTKLNTKVYPICFLAWNKYKGGARGKGDVSEWIPNQVAINKNLARRDTAIQMGAYPKMVYDTSLVENPQDLNVVGAMIGVSNTQSAVQNIVGYIQPSQISPDATNFVNEMITRTQELSGASSSALGSINPSTASGTAISLVQQASQIPLTLQKARTQRFIEDLGRCWWELLISSYENGIPITYDKEIVDENGVKTKITMQEVIPAEMMPLIKFNVKVDVSNANIYSKYSVEQNLITLFQSGVISFEEFVVGLPKDSSLPKSKFEELIESRKEREQLLQAVKQLQEQNASLQKQYGDLSQAVYEATNVGGKMMNQLFGENQTMPKK